MPTVGLKPPDDSRRSRTAVSALGQPKSRKEEEPKSLDFTLGDPCSHIHHSTKRSGFGLLDQESMQQQISPHSLSEKMNGCWSMWQDW